MLSLKIVYGGGMYGMQANFEVRAHSSYIRGYHSIVSSFNKVFHLERRWKLVRELGSGAYGVVMLVKSCRLLLFKTCNI